MSEDLSGCTLPGLLPVIYFLSQGASTFCVQLALTGISLLWHLQHLEISNTIQVFIPQLTSCPLRASIQGLPCHVLPGLSSSPQPWRKISWPLTHASLLMDSTQVWLPVWCRYSPPWTTLAVCFVCCCFQKLERNNKRKNSLSQTRSLSGWGLALRTFLLCSTTDQIFP